MKNLVYHLTNTFFNVNYFDKSLITNENFRILKFYFVHNNLELNENFIILNHFRNVLKNIINVFLIFYNLVRN